VLEGEPLQPVCWGDESGRSCGQWFLLPQQTTVKFEVKRSPPKKKKEKTEVPSFPEYPRTSPRAASRLSPRCNTQPPTMPLIVSEDEARGVNEQTASRFFAIPIEVRHPIYSQAYDLTAQHIQCVDQGYGGPRRFKFPPVETNTPSAAYTRFQLTPCVLDPTAIAEDVGESGLERNPCEPHDAKESEAVFQRRLLSSWGPHWACEELALNRGFDLRNDRRRARDLSSAMVACKKMSVAPIHSRRPLSANSSCAGTWTSSRS
jgi:hypothetical protein